MKFIIKVFRHFIDDEEANVTEPIYVKKFGQFAEWTDDIYKAKQYDTIKAAEKAAERLKNHIIYAFNKRWTSYGWNYNPDGTAYPILKNIETKVHKVELKIMD